MSAPLFMILIDSNKGIIHKILHTYCADKSEREDLMQEILKELWIAYPSWERRCTFAGWTYRIARNVAVDRLRALKRKIDTVGLHNIFYDVADNVDSPPPEISLSILTETEKEMLLLYAEGVNYNEMSKVTGMTPNGCAVRILRIKRKLQEYYKFKHI